MCKCKKRRSTHVHRSAPVPASHYHEEEIDGPAKNGEMVRPWLKGGVPSKGSLIQFVVGGLLLSRKLRIDCQFNFGFLVNQNEVLRRTIETGFCTLYTVQSATQILPRSLPAVRRWLETHPNLPGDLGRVKRNGRSKLKFGREELQVQGG